MKESTAAEVIEILKKHPDNIVARRWINNPLAIQALLDSHHAWNADHLKFNEPEMVFDLETNVLYAVDMPYSIERRLK